MSSLKSLILKNYRNHQDLILNFGDKINLLVGGNAKGKTNVLESIYFLGRGKSFRSEDWRNIIKWGEVNCRVEANFRKKNGESEAILFVDQNQKIFKLDGKKKRGMDVGVILFVPHDITIFRGHPKERRDFLNELAAGLDLAYKQKYREYLTILASRNRILKEGMDVGWGRLSTELAVWDERLVDVGSEIIIRRDRWLKEVNRVIPSIYKYMGGMGANARLHYKLSFETLNFDERSIKIAFRNKLEEKRELDKVRGVTHVGPHRDDWMALVDDNDIASYGSQGQMRVMVISIKMSELILAKENFDDPPVLLLDDVVSELDEACVVKLLSFIEKLDGQVFITSTHKDIVDRGYLKNASVFDFGRPC